MENNQTVTLIYESEEKDFSVTTKKSRSKAVEIARLHYGILMVDSEEFLEKSSFLN